MSERPSLGAAIVGSSGVCDRRVLGEPSLPSTPKALVSFLPLLRLRLGLRLVLKVESELELEPELAQSDFATPTMALKSYHKETLNDNWYEERAAPLSGVLPNDRAKEYATTTGSDFGGRHKPRMISEQNLDQAIRLTAATGANGFRSALPQPDLDGQKRYLDSTHRTSFINHFPHSSSAGTSLSLVPAGGAGGRNIERGKAASGAMGEVFRVHSEPQKDTHAQRSWMYSTDPMIVAMHAKAARGSATETPEHSLDRSATKKPEHFRRQSTSITTIPLSHRGVFADDDDDSSSSSK